MLEIILNLIFPPKCIFCKKEMSINTKLNVCDDCYKKLPFMSRSLNNTYKNSSNYFEDIICLFEYSGMVKDALTRYKFNNKPQYYRTFAKLLSDRVKKVTNCRNFDIIMSIPLHCKREKYRGYNQSYLISRALSKELQIAECSRFLFRGKNTISQSSLDRNERSENIRGAFKIRNPEKIQSKRILLVDDILTTGSTMNECSKILMENGATEVIATVLASGRKY